VKPETYFGQFLGSSILKTVAGDPPPCSQIPAGWRDPCNGARGRLGNPLGNPIRRRRESCFWLRAEPSRTFLKTDGLMPNNLLPSPPLASLRIMVALRSLLPLLAALAVEGRAWHTPPHQQITRAAVDSLPTPMQERLGLEKEMLIWVNCMYPDRYRGLGQQGPEKDPNPGPRTRAELKIYCELPDGRIIHNVTQNRAEDLASFEHLLQSIIKEMRRDNITAAARYMGTLAHLIEDSCSPAHADKLPLVLMELRKQEPIPNPPPWVGRLNEHGGTLTAGNLHAAIELTTLPFNLAGRSPQRTGETVADAAPKLLDRCYAIVAENRADLLEMVRATYANDLPVMERIRSRAARKAAELLADAYYTALSIAAEPR
jgi:hypothetical protein